MFRFLEGGLKSRLNYLDAMTRVVRSPSLSVDFSSLFFPSVSTGGNNPVRAEATKYVRQMPV